MKMSESEEKINIGTDIEESLEFCEDIYRFYESEDKSVDHFNIKKPQIPDIDTSHFQYEPSVVKEKEIIVEKQSFLSQVLFFAVSIMIAVFLSKILNGMIIQETRVEGHSMNPTLYHHERLILNKFSYRKSMAERYDIVVFSFNNGEHFVKRIIGLPGEKVTIKDGRVYINDRILLDDPILEEIEYAGVAEEGVIVGNNEYFVLGDNRNHSYDSRYGEIGNINKKVILGKVWLRFYPWNRIGLVK